MRFRVSYQHDSMQCGAACLRMVCKHYGKEYALDFLSEQCGCMIDGVSLQAIRETAEDLGFRTFAVSVGLSELQAGWCPCILHWERNHFVVLYRIHKDKYHVADPAKGTVIYRKEDFLKRWAGDGEQGIALLLEPTQAFYDFSSGMEPKVPSPFRFLWRYIASYKKAFASVALTLLVGSLVQLVLPLLAQMMVDKGIGHKNIPLVYLILGGQLVLVLGSAAMEFVRNRLLLFVGMHVNISLITDFFAKLFRLPISFFETRTTGDLLQRIVDHRRVQDFLTGQVLSVLFSVMVLCIFMGVLFSYNSFLFLVFLAGSIGYGLWTMCFLHKRKLFDYMIFEKQSASNNKVYQLLTFMQEIKLQGGEGRRAGEWEALQKELLDIQMRSLSLQQFQQTGGIFISQSKNLVVTVIAAVSVIEGEMTLGMLLAVQFIIGQLNIPIEQLMQFLYNFQNVRLSIERISAIHGKAEERTGKEIPEQPEISRKDIRIEHLDFKYNLHGKAKVLDDITLTIPAQRTTAIVGASGSGKSTIAKLLLKYYEPQSGDITIDGMDISEYRNDDIRRAVSYVPQNIELFSKSIYDNIRVTRQSATLDEVREAAKAADAHEFIKRLPMQYYTYLEEAGNGLSGGEKQRIALARAFLKENQFYIMDESTSNLDFATENIIFDMIYNKFRKKTMLIIAHRLATVKNCDKIIVMDKGKIIEQGTHKELLEKKGQYYRLWEMQQGNFVIREDEIKEKQCEDSVESDDKGVMSYT